MKQKSNYTKAPKGVAQAIEASQIIDDFLPPPATLVLFEQPNIGIMKNANTRLERLYGGYPIRESDVG